MKTKVAILILFSILLASCAPETPTQERQADVIEVAPEAPLTEVQVTEEPVVTEEPIATEPPTEISAETPIACVTLLTPIDGVEIPPVGKVTFSWTALEEARKYVLNIILPSGDVVPFETGQTFRDRYMEAFTSGGEYQWQVVAQDVNGSEICVSNVARFVKSAYVPPKNIGGNDGNGQTCPPDCNWGGGGGTK